MSKLYPIKIASFSLAVAGLSLCALQAFAMGSGGKGQSTTGMLPGTSIPIQVLRGNNVTTSTAKPPQDGLEPAVNPAAAQGEDLLKDEISELQMDPDKVKGLAPEEIMLLSVQKDMKKELDILDKVPLGVPTLFFSPHEHALLERALVGYDANSAGRKSDVPGEAVPALNMFDDAFHGARELSLSGIVFDAGGKWIVWMNKQRLTPTRLPVEVRDIKVHKDFIELKWYDTQSAKIHAIRLRPNQRFNLDSQSFLPG